MSALNTLPDTQPSKVGKTEKSEPVVSGRKSPNQRKYEEVRSREYLLPSEVDTIMKAIKKHGGRHAHRDATLVLLLYRHGLRVGEVAGLRWSQVDFTAATLHVNRLKNGSRAVHPLYGDELRALRRLQKDYPNTPFIFMSSRKSPLAPDSIRGIFEQAGKLAELPFPVHAHILRHACGYYLAREKTDTRTIQGYLGHRNTQHTVWYTQLSPEPYKGLWKKA